MASSVSVPDEEVYLQYRSLSMAAVFALVMGLLSIPAFFYPVLLAIPVVGLLVGVFALLRLRRRQDELTGYKAALIGFVLSLTMLVGGSARAAIELAFEVPEGFNAISFEQLQPDKRYPQMPIPPAAMELDGKKIFVKGYVHPGVDRRTGIKQFILVPDMKTCCFGGQPELTDMIQVTLKDPLRINYSYAKRKLAGTLRVSPHKKAISGLDGVYYQLDAEYLK